MPAKRVPSLTSIKRAVGRRAKRLDAIDNAAAQAMAERQDARFELWSLGCELLLKVAGGIELAEPRAGALALGFRWPAHSRARVDEEVQRSSGPQASMRYDVALGRAERVGLQRVTTSGFEFLTFQGADVTTAEMRMKLGPARAVAEVIPTLLVNGRGHCAGIEDEDAVFARLEQVTGKRVSEPSARATFRHSYAKAWRAWLGGVAGLEVGSSGRGEGTVDVLHRLPLDRTLAAHATWRCEPVVQLPGYVWVSIEAPLRGAQACDALREGLEALCPIDAPAHAMIAPQFELGLALEVICERATGRPEYAARLASARLLGEGEPISAYEAQQWSFDWRDA